MRRLFDIVCVLICGIAPVGAARATNTGQGASWDEVKQLPDWGGVWNWVNKPVPTFPMTAKGQEQLDMIARIRGAQGDIPARSKNCVLGGFPADPVGPEEYTTEFTFTPGQITVTGSQGYARRLYTDGRKHRGGRKSLQGDSIAHWEGDTLVVDTVSLNDGNELYYGFRGGADMHIVERIHLTDANTLAMDYEITAQEMFTQPIHYTTFLARHRDWTTLEMNCAQNQRSVDENGNQTLELTRKPYSSDKEP